MPSAVAVSHNAYQGHSRKQWYSATPAAEHQALHGTAQRPLLWGEISTKLAEACRMEEPDAPRIQ